MFKLPMFLQWEFFFHWVMVNALGSCLALSAAVLTVGRHILGVRIQPQLVSQYLPGVESRLWGFFLTLNLLFPVSPVLSLEYIEGKQNN